MSEKQAKKYARVTKRNKNKIIKTFILQVSQKKFFERLKISTKIIFKKWGKD